MEPLMLPLLMQHRKVKGVWLKDIHSIDESSIPHFGHISQKLHRICVFMKTYTFYNKLWGSLNISNGISYDVFSEAIL